MVLTQEKLLKELKTAHDSNPDMYIGDLINHVVDTYHPTRKPVQVYYTHKIKEVYPITNTVLLDSLQKYNKSRQENK